MESYTFVYPFTSWWAFGFFSLCAIIKNADINTSIPILVLAYILTSFRYTPRSKSAGSLDHTLNILQKHTLCLTFGGTAYFQSMLDILEVWKTKFQSMLCFVRDSEIV